MYNIAEIRCRVLHFSISRNSSIWRQGMSHLSMAPPWHPNSGIRLEHETCSTIEGIFLRRETLYCSFTTG